MVETKTARDPLRLCQLQRRRGRKSEVRLGSLPQGFSLAEPPRPIRRRDACVCLFRPEGQRSPALAANASRRGPCKKVNICDHHILLEYVQPGHMGEAAHCIWSLKDKMDLRHLFQVNTNIQHC